MTQYVELTLLAPAVLAVCFVLMYNGAQDEARKFMYSIAAVLSMFILVGMAIFFLSTGETVAVLSPPYNVLATNISTSGNVFILVPTYTSNDVYTPLSSAVPQYNGLLLLVEIIMVFLVIFLIIDLLFIKPWQQKRKMK